MIVSPISSLSRSSPALPVVFSIVLEWISQNKDTRENPAIRNLKSRGWSRLKVLPKCVHDTLCLPVCTNDSASSECFSSASLLIKTRLLEMAVGVMRRTAPVINAELIQSLMHAWCCEWPQCFGNACISFRGGKKALLTPENQQSRDRNGKPQWLLCSYPLVHGSHCTGARSMLWSRSCSSSWHHGLHPKRALKQ